MTCAYPNMFECAQVRHLGLTVKTYYAIRAESPLHSVEVVPGAPVTSESLGQVEGEITLRALRPSFDAWPQQSSPNRVLPAWPAGLPLVYRSGTSVFRIEEKDSVLFEFTNFTQTPAFFGADKCSGREALKHAWRFSSVRPIV